LKVPFLGLFHLSDKTVNIIHMPRLVKSQKNTMASLGLPQSISLKLPVWLQLACRLVSFEVNGDGMSPLAACPHPRSLQWTTICARYCFEALWVDSG